MVQSRKQFLNTASLSFFGLLALPDFSLNDNDEIDPVVVHAEEGETFWIGTRNSPLTIKVSKDKNGSNAFSFCTEEIAPQEGIPVHKHLNEDELIFVHSGEGILTVGDQEIAVKSGSVALIPKNVWHGVKNTGKETFIMVFSYSPAGFEGYFREFGSPAGTNWQPKSKEEYFKLNQKWGIVYK